ncbi:hypothetical protein ACFQY4_09465 [Catellatospora bangladeshensis]|uniref:hypothetical protein n=1 Tax=Catellatospora bangladeshensis TaxID=310355 RepID=UPI0036139F74
MPSNDGGTGGIGGTVGIPPNCVAPAVTRCSPPAYRLMATCGGRPGTTVSSPVSRSMITVSPLPGSGTGPPDGAGAQTTQPASNSVSLGSHG